MVVENIQNDRNLLNNIYVVLVNPLYQGNIGAIARSMANFNLDKLVIIGNIILNDEARNRAKHANNILNNAIYYNDFEKARESFDLVVGTSGIIGNDYNLPRSPLLIDELISNLKDFNGKIGLFFGPEDKGLSNKELNLCDFVINIPCSENYSVMNISHSATIIFYELFKNFEENNLRKNHVLASVKEKDIAYFVINDVLDNMNFRADSDRDTQKVLWHRVLGKSFVTKREISSMIGFFKNVKFVLEKSKKSDEFKKIKKNNKKIIS